MGGRSYMLATRMPMSRAGFDAWLGTPLPGLDVIANPAAMWSGWAGDGGDPDWDLTAIAGSPAAVAAIRAARGATPLRLLAARTANGVTLARYHDGALEVYLYDYHSDVYGTQTDLLMLAGAGRFADEGAPVLFWGGDVYPDLPLGGDLPLAVLLVDRGGARFVDRYPVDALIRQLRPVEAAFLAAAEAADDATAEAVDDAAGKAAEAAGGATAEVAPEATGKAAGEATDRDGGPEAAALLDPAIRSAEPGGR